MSWFLTLSLIILSPALSQGFSIERNSEYKKQILERHLAYSQDWLRLGHYHKSVWNLNSYESRIRGDFFISSQGASNPEAELLATIDTLFSPSKLKKHPQCRYLARTAWLKKVLMVHSDDLESCTEQENWKKQLGVTEVFIVFAASDLSSAASSFGHTFLRLHNPHNTGKLDLLDYGVNYSATTGDENGALFALKGLFGLYPGSFSMLPYHQKIREYTNLEGRDLWEYKLRLNPEEVDYMINHLLELEGSYSPYYFSHANCSSQILEIIEVAKPALDLSDQFSDLVIPLETLKVLETSWLLEDGKLRSSLQAEWHQRYSHLNFSQRLAVQEVIKSTSLSSTEFQNLQPEGQAETLEASLNYLALKEYREQKEFKDQKYNLALARAKLGPITEPVEIFKPRSPLLSSSSEAMYLGYGQDRSQEFYALKWRRGFHDLISDDSGLTPYSQLQFLSGEFHYTPSLQRWNLQQLVLLNIITTYPWTEFEHPLSWKVDIGTEPQFAPYANGGIGVSADLPLSLGTRWALFLVSENDHLSEVARPHFGAETFLISKWTSHFRSLLDAKILYSTSEGKRLNDMSMGLSYDVNNFEFHLEARNRDDRDSWLLSVIF